MIQYGNLKDILLSYREDEKFTAAFSFLEKTQVKDLPEGKFYLDNGIWGVVQQYVTREEVSLDFESHNLYIDIQYIAAGKEYICCANRKELSEKTAYSEEKDITFYHDSKVEERVLLCAGDLIILMPQDAHKPCCAVDEPETVKKIVIKVPV